MKKARSQGRKPIETASLGPVIFPIRLTARELYAGRMRPVRPRQFGGEEWEHGCALVVGP